uniref:Putative ORF3 protein n=1 Tax=Spalax hepevirus TaxID=2796360 RepID=A0A8E0NA88_9VIRU|nr:TPA: putative ORF3 protein [Spalax hepevirus]
MYILYWIQLRVLLNNISFRARALMCQRTSVASRQCCVSLSCYFCLCTLPPDSPPLPRRPVPAETVSLNPFPLPTPDFGPSHPSPVVQSQPLVLPGLTIPSAPILDGNAINPNLASRR